MSNESHSPEIAQQGSLFEAHIVPSGVTDPELSSQSVVFEAAPDGHYDEEAAPETNRSEDTVVIDGLKEAVAKKKNHDAQIGLHSPLQRSGSYQNGLKVGDYLPGFGPVKYRNLDEAQRHAARLDRERR